jgi:hypothetical protein
MGILQIGGERDSLTHTIIDAGLNDQFIGRIASTRVRQPGPVASRRRSSG